MMYRKKPVVINAFQWNGTVECLRKNVNKKDWDKFRIDYGVNGYWHLDQNLPQFVLESCLIWTLEGLHEANKGDYIIKGVHGEYYPCKPDIFNETYERA